MTEQEYQQAVLDLETKYQASEQARAAAAQRATDLEEHNKMLLKTNTLLFSKARLDDKPPVDEQKAKIPDPIVLTPEEWAQKFVKGEIK